MRYILAFLLALALLMAQAQPATLYVLEWHSALPIDPASIQATITGGALISTLTTADATTGWIEATAPLACLTIDAQAQTTSGVRVRFSRSWDAGCVRVYAPMVMR